MPGVMRRASSKLPQGDYLDKDELFREKEPMGIKSGIFDTSGSQFGPRWVASVEPWYEGQDEPVGLITFTNNPSRQPIFEDLQAQIEENNNESIGPVTLIRVKTQKGFRVYTFADFIEDGVVTGEPVSATPAPRAPRPTAPAQRSTPSPAELDAMASYSREATAETAPRRRGRPAGSKNRPKENNGESSAPSATAISRETKSPEREVAGQEQILAVGEAVCPNCGDVVRGRVL